MSNLIWFSDSYILMFRDLGNCTTCYLFHFKNTFITTETNTSVSNWACALSACQVNHLNQLLLHFYLLFFPILLGITKLNRKKKITLYYKICNCQPFVCGIWLFLLQDWEERYKALIPRYSEQWGSQKDFHTGEDLA